MIDAIMEHAHTGLPGIISFKVPEYLKPLLYAYIVRNKTNQYRVRIEKPRKKRSTGEGSQNHHINGHVQQIAVETGNDFDTIKTYVKTRAVDMGYPFDTIKGVVIPWSETRIDTEQAAILIEACHLTAAEEGIILRED